jgi:hypothetical protein
MDVCRCNHRPWSRATTSPAGIDQVATSLAKTGQVDLLDGGNMQPKPSLAKATPTIYVSQAPTEMLVFQGQPTLTPHSRHQFTVG